MDVFRARGLEAAAGIRQPMTAFVAEHADRVRLIVGRFKETRQAVGAPRKCAPETVRFLRAVLEELKPEGFVADALRRSHQSSTRVAPPA